MNMLNKLLVPILALCVTSFAQFYYTPSAQEGDTPINADNASSAQLENCTDDLTELSMQKRKLVKKFEECANKQGDYKVSILFFTVAEGETGQSEAKACLEEYMGMLKPLATCIKTKHPNVSLFSIDERNSYMYYLLAKMNESDAANELLSYVSHYKQIQEQLADLQILDQFDKSDEEIVLKFVSLENMEKSISEMNGSREDKDVLRLYFKYLKSKYNYRFRCQLKPAFICDTSWLGDEKGAFLKKYPESAYKEFVETQMPGFADLTDEEKAQAKAENNAIKEKKREDEIAQKIAERDVWVALTGIAMFGIPVIGTSGFDDNYDVSKMFGIALRASYRRAFFQYQYNFAPGDNNKGGSISQKSYSLMGGVAIGPKKWFTIDLLFGLSYIDSYPKNEGISRADLDYSSWALAVQGNYYFPISDSWDVVAFAQARMNYIENHCRNEYLEPDNYGTRCRDPYNDGSTGASSWEGMQWTFSLGVGVRFWKPKPASLY